VRIDRSAARDAGRQMDVANLLALIVEVIAVRVEKRVERDVEPLTGQDLRRAHAVLPVDLDLDAGPVIFRQVVDGETITLDLERLDVGRFPARDGAQAQARQGDDRGEDCAHGL